MEEVAFADWAVRLRGPIREAGEDATEPLDTDDADDDVTDDGGGH